MHLNTRKTKEPIKKNEPKMLNRHFSKEDIQVANKHEKMYNITHYQRNANQKHNEVPSHTSQNGCYQKVYKQMLERMRKKGTLLHCWWECKLVQPLWSTV